MDIGCFFTRRDGRWFYKGEYPRGNADPAYRELYTRMFQWGTFLPVMRSHGSDTPREPWFFGSPGTPYYDAIIDMINIRYRLTPYTYSLAAMQTFSNYTMARMLAFDFPHDKEVLDIKDEYMFGDILVCPVTDSCATSRRVYLPDGTEWIDYWTGAPYAGGQWIDALAPINRLPLYVRAGSIIPTTAPAEHTAAQVGNPVTVEVYPGADAEFTLYEDEGDSYNYEKGFYSTITLKWTEKSKTLTVGRRKGEYPGMPLNRKLNVKVIGAGEKTIDYSGERVNVKM
jgi:alpha-D-xyloside xylohydrolase